MAQHRGVVAWFNEIKGFGYITPEGGGKDVFVQVSGIASTKTLSAGLKVMFEIEDGPKGPSAIHVTAIG